MDLFTTALMILAGLYLADFGTATVHWMVDKYADPSWPFIGPHYVYHSHNHHDDAKALFEISFLERHGFILSVVSLTALALWGLGWLNAFTGSALVFGALTNKIHGWSHHTPAQNGPIITMLHRVGLLQSQTHHVHHHSDVNGSHYALLTDHMNPVLETLGLFPFLEDLIAWCGLTPYWWDEATAETKSKKI